MQNGRAVIDRKILTVVVSVRQNIEMPTSPKEQDKFQKLLAQEKTLAFTDVLQIFINKNGKYNNLSDNFAGEIDKTDITQLARHYCWAGVKQAEIVRIIGERKGSMILAERVRAFTHYFAFNLVTRNHGVLCDHREGRRSVQGVWYRYVLGVLITARLQERRQEQTLGVSAVTFLEFTLSFSSGS